jgi:DNA polymerase-4
VKADRARKSVGAERTFDRDIASAPALRETLANITALTWDDIKRLSVRGRTVTLKLRFSDFSLRTHSRTLPDWVAGKAEFTAIGQALLAELLPLPQPVRLMGLTLSSLDSEKDETPSRAADAQLSLL